MRLTRAAFERCVAEAYAQIPERIRNRFRNVAIVIQDAPTREQLDTHDVSSEETLYGYYEGTPLTERGGEGEPLLPDRITIFQGPIEEDCMSAAEVRNEVHATLRHELAHHLGIEDDRLEEIGKY